MIQLNSNQIVLATDPINQSYFGLNGEVERICFNATEWYAQQHQFQANAYQFGLIVFAAGLIIGGLIVYARFRWYGNS